jgi:hypothetical protein
MHLVKGLEFRAVAVMVGDDEMLPLQSRIETVADEAEQLQHCHPEPKAKDLGPAACATHVVNHERLCSCLLYSS